MDASTFAALGEPSRLRIVELLRSGPRSVGDIVEALGTRQPQVSKHLHVLGESGIVAVRPLARRRIYHLEAEPFDAIGHWVDSFERCGRPASTRSASSWISGSFVPARPEGPAHIEWVDRGVSSNADRISDRSRRPPS